MAVSSSGTAAALFMNLGKKKPSEPPPPTQGKIQKKPGELPPAILGKIQKKPGELPPAIQDKILKALKRLEDTSLEKARSVARAGQMPKDLTVDELARLLFVMEVEAPSEGVAFRAKLKDNGDVLRQVTIYHELYDMPCRGQVTRDGTRWPPKYGCSETARDPSPEPTPFVFLRAPPSPIPPPADEADKPVTPVTSDKKVQEERFEAFRSRDEQSLPNENLAAPPARFCVKGSCDYKTYDDVAAALYGGRPPFAAPVFCAPRAQGGGWDASTVECSTSWLDTLGTWKPWKPNGEPFSGQPSAPEVGAIPPFACFGSPHLLKKHMMLPAGGEAGSSGFFCRNRVFRVLAQNAPKDQADLNAGIANMCLEMRGQVWGEKYGADNINKQYAAWCQGPEGPADKSLCPKVAPAGAAANAPLPPLPFMLLSREELLFFFGHQELYCRADRSGLVHFLDPEQRDRWAKTFTCNVPRGLLEAGPFEEGVQTCAITPFAGGDVPAAPGKKIDTGKARLHCWKFRRPTCEELSQGKKPDDIRKSNVFDAYDALREFRRTRKPEVFSFYDLRDAEKLADFQESLSFSDLAKDEGTFGVKDFCRFVSDTRKIQCGYTKETLAQWYELRKSERPEGCNGGVCARGAFRRGYLCGLFAAKEYFEGKPLWICGVDIGVTGRRVLDGAGAICVGGARAKSFISARGDKGSLQCYERRFRWGESAKSEGILRAFQWANVVKEVAQGGPWLDPWLFARPQAMRFLEDLLAAGPPGPKSNNVIGIDIKAENWAKPVLKDHGRQDAEALAQWAARYGHTLGHRTSLRKGLMSSGIAVIEEFKRLPARFGAVANLSQQPLGFKADRCQSAFPACGSLAPQIYDYRQGQGKAAARSEEKAKALRDLVGEVARAERSADAKWYQDFRLEATEDGQLRITPQELEIALRVHQLFNVLEVARGRLLEQAKRYADAVFEATARAPVLSRLEVHELARIDPIAHELKGNAFCVADSQANGGRARYVCASSSLLAAGQVERRLAEVMRGTQGDATKLRNQIKIDWCYGGMKGMPLYGSGPNPALSTDGVSSPFYMEVPATVRLVRRKASLGPSKRKLEGLARGDTAAPKAPIGDLVSATLKLAKLPVATPPPNTGRRIRLTKLPVMEAVSDSNWLKCAGLTYSDENWELADPKREPKPQPPPQPGQPPPTAGQTPGGGGDASAVMDKVGGLIGQVVNLVLPRLGHAPEMVRNMAHGSSEFIDKWAGKMQDIAKGLWNEVKKKSEDLSGAQRTVEEKVKQAEDKLDQARSKMHAAEVEAAAAIGPAKQAAADKVEQMKRAFTEATSGVKDAKAAVEKKAREVVEVVKNQCKAFKQVQGSGELLSPMLEELTTEIAKRVMGVIEPNARHLISFGMRWVRTVLGPIAKAVVSALAGVPFIGAGLAPLGQIAYDMALNALEDAAFDLLMGVVERALAKLMGGVVTPVFKAVQRKIEAIVHSSFANVLGKICSEYVGELKFAALPPRDRWIERAYACKTRPLIDDRVLRDAEIARRQILRTAGEMRRGAAALAKGIANRYLARFGLTYDTWMASVAQGAAPQVVAQAKEITQSLRSTAEELRARVKR
jgi:hypothetical protein